MSQLPLWNSASVLCLSSFEGSLLFFSLFIAGTVLQTKFEATGKKLVALILRQRPAGL
jgi:hypothetical protein